MAEKTALLIATDGSEEMEVVITADVLVRGGVKVTIAGLNGAQPFKCARGTRIVPDAAFEEAKNGSYDVIILPGGQPGSNTLAAHEGVGFLLREQTEKGRLVAAICAAPIAFKSHKIPAALVTSHPSVQKQLEEGGYKYSTDRVVVSGNVVTSRGPGTAFEFGLKLVELLNGVEKANSLVEPLILKL